MILNELAVTGSEAKFEEVIVVVDASKGSLSLND